MTQNEAKEAQLRAVRAKQILNDDLVTDAFRDIRQHLYAELEKVKYDDNKKLQDVQRMLRAVSWFEKKFTQHIETGEIAKSFLEKFKII